MAPIRPHPLGSEPARRVRRRADGHYGYLTDGTAESPPRLRPATQPPLPRISVITQTSPVKAPMTGDPTDLHTGCLAWQLPADPSCAGVARTLTGSALARLGLPADLIDSAQLAISELVTNARAPRGALSYSRRSREELEGGFWV